jgi:hypothetical protein
MCHLSQQLTFGVRSRTPFESNTTLVSLFKGTEIVANFVSQFRGIKLFLYEAYRKHLLVDRFAI